MMLYLTGMTDRGKWTKITKIEEVKSKSDENSRKLTEVKELTYVFSCFNIIP